MRFFKNNITLLIVILLVSAGASTYFMDSSIRKNIRKNRRMELQSAHNEAVDKVKNSLNNFATIVSALKVYVESSEDLPGDKALQTYLVKILSEIDYSDSIVVSYLDTKHYFRYSFTRTQIDPAHLVGKCVMNFRDTAHVREIEKAMRDSVLYLFQPINLIEGWPGIPFVFGIHKNGKSIGYLAPIVDFSNIIKPVYTNPDLVSKFAFKFQVVNGPEFDRYTVYNGYKTYSNNKDEENYKNFNLDESDFIYTTIEKYGLQLKIGTAYKHKPSKMNKTSLILWSSYSLFVLLMLFLLYNFIKIKKLNSSIEASGKKILTQNIEIAEQRDIALSKTKELSETIEKLKESESIISKKNNELMKLSHVVSHTDNAVMITDSEGNIEWVNRGFTMLYGYTLEEFTAKDDNILVTNTNHHANSYIQDAILHKKTVTYEVEVKHKNGTKLWIKTTWTPVFDKNGDLINLIAVDSDITELKKAELQIIKQNQDLSKYQNRLEEIVKERTKELQIALQKATESDRLKSAFLSNLSHEIRTPMNAIVGFTQLIAAENDEFSQKYSTLITRNSENLMRLINDIVALSEIQTSEIKVYPHPVSISNLLEKIYQDLLKERDFKNKSYIKINLEFTKTDASETFITDEIRLKKILEKLTENALKYTEQGSITIACKELNDNSFRFSVKDTGIGIEQEYLDSIFEIFRKDEGNGKLYRGLGIGLTLVKEYVNALNGSVSVKSEVGKGSEFIVILNELKSPNHTF